MSLRQGRHNQAARTSVDEMPIWQDHRLLSCATQFGGHPQLFRVLRVRHPDSAAVASFGIAFQFATPNRTANSLWNTDGLQTEALVTYAD